MNHNLPSVVAGKKTKSEKDDKFKQIKVRSVGLIVQELVNPICCKYFLIAPTVYCGGYLHMLVVWLRNYSYPACLGLGFFEI